MSKFSTFIDITKSIHKLSQKQVDIKIDRHILTLTNTISDYGIHAEFYQIDLSGIDLRRLSAEAPDGCMSHVNFTRCKFDQSTIDLAGVSFRSCTFYQCVFENVNLSKAFFDEYCLISATRFVNSNLSYAKFINLSAHSLSAVFENCDLSYSDLTGFSGAIESHEELSKWDNNAKLIYRFHRSNLYCAKIPMDLLQIVQGDFTFEPCVQSLAT